MLLFRALMRPDKKSQAGPGDRHPIELRRPRNWFTLKGRIDRQSFWSFYLLLLMILFTTGWLMELLRGHMPGLVSVIAPLLMPCVMIFTMASLSSAMVRRLRDAGRHWWPVPATALAFLLFASGAIFEVYNIGLAQQQGDARAYFENRFPLSEVLLLPFIVASGWLFFGLSRRGRQAQISSD